MVFFFDKIVEYFRENPQDFETIGLFVGVGLFFLGIDLLFGTFITSRVIEYFGNFINSLF